MKKMMQESLKLQKIHTVISGLILVVLAVAALVVVPNAVSTLNGVKKAATDASTALESAMEIMEDASTTIGDAKSTMENVNGTINTIDEEVLPSLIDRLNTLETTLQNLDGAVKDIDTEALNEAITNLAEAMAPLAGMANLFGGGR